MLKNYFTIALRNLRRRPGYSAINVGGLAIGLASCVLILLYVYDELSFDRFNKKYDRIQRVVEIQVSPEGNEVHTAFTASPVGRTLVQDMPEVERSVRLAGPNTIGRRAVEKGQNRFYEQNYFFTEPAFFDIFDFEFIQGSASTALSEPNTAVLTRQAALQYFGNENPVGQTLFIEQFGEMLITGLLEDPPRNSHLDFTLLFSFSTLENQEGWGEWLETWDSSRILTYITLNITEDASSLQAKIPGFMERYQADRFGVTRKIYLQPLSDIHFDSAHIESEVNWREGNYNYLYVFSAIALFLLLIACVNYINLATAQALKRAREVGVRKALGAFRQQLVRQFLGESGLLTVLASVMALGIVWLVLPFFNELADKQIDLNLQTSGLIWIAMLVLLLIVGMIAGAYPAFYLARFQPADVLKGELKAGNKAVRVRQGLVIAQFALSIALVIGTFVISSQLNYIQDKQLGYNEEAMLVVDINSGNARTNFESMKRELGTIASVQQVSVASNIPGDWKDIPQVEVIPEAVAAGASHSMYFIGADSDFLSTFEIQLSAGRNFSTSFGTDSTAVLLNESAARVLGISEPTGQLINIPRRVTTRNPTGMQHQVRVIGIVRDFHFKSLHEPIAPLVLAYWSNPIDVIDYFAIRVQTSDMAATLAHLQQVGELYDPDHPFEYNFLDERLNDFYQTERRVSTLVSTAAGLAIFIACLGLLGLAAFSAEQRVKEIGVRKVMGASVPNIVSLLSSDFLKLVIIAFFVGAPLAYFGMNLWLEAFSYRIQMGIGTFALALLLSVTIAFMTVLYQSLRAALANPIQSLRYE